MQNAIKIESDNLEELYQINKNADSLAALLLAQKEEKLAFEKEMHVCRFVLDEEISQKKTAWKKEQEDFARALKESSLQLQKERSREQDEFVYATQLERKKNQDLYLQRKESLEKELSDKKNAFEAMVAEREKTLRAREDEFKLLTARVEQFPAELEKAIQVAEKTTTMLVDTKYQHQIELTALEFAAENKLNQHVVSSLQVKIKKQEDFIRQLTQKTNDANNQVQAIAFKALEGAISPRLYGHQVEKVNQTSGS